MKELGHLVLAITLAGSYIFQKPRLLSHLPYYVEEYQQQRWKLLDTKPTKISHQYEHSVMATWELSYSAVGSQLPEACRFLALLVFLNYENINLKLFIPDYPPTSIISQSWSWVILEGEASLQLLEGSFAALEKYSLL